MPNLPQSSPHTSNVSSLKHCTDDRPVYQAYEPAWKGPKEPTPTTQTKGDLNNNTDTPEQSESPQDSSDFNEITTETVSTTGVKQLRVMKTPYKDINNCINIPDYNSPAHLPPPIPLSTLNTPNIFEEMEKMRMEQDHLLNLVPTFQQDDVDSTFIRGLNGILPLDAVEECQPDNIVQLTNENAITQVAQPWETWGQTIESQEIPQDISTDQDLQRNAHDQLTETDPPWQEKAHQEVTFDPKQVFKTSMWYHIDHMGVLTSIMDEMDSVQGETRERKRGVCKDKDTQTIRQSSVNKGIMAVQNTRQIGVGCVHSMMDTSCQTQPNMGGSSTQTVSSLTTDTGTQCHPEKRDASTNTPSKVQIPMTITMELLSNKDTKFKWCHDE
jgi:hypothetical protein